jgi:hypothetical protein
MPMNNSTHPTVQLKSNSALGCSLPHRSLVHLTLLFLALLAVGMGLSACSFKAKTPEAFAAYPRGIVFKGPFKAVSPEGILFSVRSEKNEPVADLAYWRIAMKTRMSNAGYRVISDSASVMGGQPGALLKLAAPVGNNDYFYWIGISVTGKDILVAEAAGEAKPFLARANEIEKAISAVSW